MRPTIYKYDLRTQEGYQSIIMPQGCTLLSIGNQNDSIKLWAYSKCSLADIERVFVKRIIYAAPTGYGIPPEIDPTKFIGTIQIKGYVLHIFDVREENE